MMIESCRLHLSLFNNSWISEAVDSVTIVETDPGGASKALFEVAGPCIVIRSHKQPPLLWALAQRKCADGAFLTFDTDGGAHLHIVELKSKITIGTWATALSQLEGMFLASLAVSRLMDVHKFASVTCYVAGTENGMTEPIQTTTTPALIKIPVGLTRSLGQYEAWQEEQIDLPHNVKAPLRKAWKDKSMIADFGAV